MSSHSLTVLLSAYACEPERGSEPGNGWNWAEHLAKRGHRVELLTRPAGVPAIRVRLNNQPLDSLSLHVVEEPVYSKPLPARVAMYARYCGWQRLALEHAHREAA
jgi:hypothetical protein